MTNKKLVKNGLILWVFSMTVDFSGQISSLLLMTLKQNNEEQGTEVQKEGIGLSFILSYSKPHFPTPVPVIHVSSLFYTSSYTTDWNDMTPLTPQLRHPGCKDFFDSEDPQLSFLISLTLINNLSSQYVFHFVTKRENLPFSLTSIPMLTPPKRYFNSSHIKGHGNPEP